MIVKHLKISILILLVVLCAIGPVWGLQRQVGEYQVKAAFLYNFAKFVDWPSCSTCKVSDVLVVGILGEDPFGEAIQSIDGKRVKEKTLRVIRAGSLDELRGSDIIFISASAKKELPKILKILEGKPVLTVGDTNGFAQKGVMINLFESENKIRFEVNPSAAEKAGLKISSQLLRLAKIITREDNPGGQQ